MKTIISVAMGLAVVAGPALAAPSHVDTGLGTPTACGLQWKRLNAINAAGGLTRAQFMRQCVVKYNADYVAPGAGGTGAGMSSSTLLWVGVGAVVVGGVVAGVVVSNDNGNHTSP